VTGSLSASADAVSDTGEFRRRRAQLTLGVSHTTVLAADVIRNTVTQDN